MRCFRQVTNLKAVDHYRVDDHLVRRHYGQAKNLIRAYEDRWLGGETFVSFDKKAVQKTPSYKS
jgi:hypothetical protein